MEANNVVYSRILREEMNRNINFKVEIVGFVRNINSNVVKLETGDKQLIEIKNFKNIQELDIDSLIEVRGEVEDTNKLIFEDYNKLPNIKFNLELFEKSLLAMKKIKI